MHEFRYDYAKPKYEEKTKLCPWILTAVYIKLPWYLGDVCGVSVSMSSIICFVNSITLVPNRIELTLYNLCFL